MARRRSVSRSEEPSRLDLGGDSVDYLLRRSSARRTLALRVDLQGRVVVNAPLRLPQGEINRFIFRHADWLKGQLARHAVAGPGWHDGMQLPFLGGWLTLRLDTTHPAVRHAGDELCLPAGVGPEAAVTAWYRKQARPLLARHLEQACRRIGRELPVWRVSSARTRWGSLSPSGVVRLNWRLIKASPAEIDYVICHELAHFKQRNHSPAFWREVEALCADYAHLRDRLREQSRLYFQF